MCTTTVRVFVAGTLANALRVTWPVEVIVQFAVLVSSQPQTVAVPPSRVYVIGLHVLPSSAAPVGLAGGLAQSAWAYVPWGWSRCGSYGFLADMRAFAFEIPASARS